jgi:hypothetical protein
MPMVVTSDLQTVILTVLGIPIPRIPTAMVDIRDHLTATQIVLEIQQLPTVITMARYLVHHRAIRIHSETRLQTNVLPIRIPVSGAGNSLHKNIVKLKASEFGCLSML